MSQTIPAVGPFAMLLDPEAVLAAVNRSELLARLQSRVCRPLDRSSGPIAPIGAADDASTHAGHDDLPGSPLA